MQGSRMSTYVKKTQNDLLVYNSEIASQQKESDNLRLQHQDEEAVCPPPPSPSPAR